MGKRTRRILIFLSVLLSSSGLAESTEIYAFNSATEQLHFQHMTEEIRCLVCQNQNIADSNAPLANDLRQIIYEEIKKGNSERVIKKYLVDRYGEYILLKPLFSPLTYVLWLGPFLLLLIIVIKIFCGMKCGP